MTLRRLTAASAARLAEDLAALDRALVDELGDDFSTEVWGPGHFTSARPGKWSLSYYAVAAGGVAGYWIASQPTAATVHVHRVAVAASARHQGLGRRLFAAGRAAAEAVGAASMTLCVGAGNESAQGFYRQLGFQFLSGEALTRYAADHGVVAAAGGIRDGAQVLRVMALDLRD